MRFPPRHYLAMLVAALLSGVVAPSPTTAQIAVPEHLPRHWVVSEQLGHDWQDELVYFECWRKDRDPSQAYVVKDQEGQTYPAQILPNPNPDGAETVERVAIQLDLPAHNTRTLKLIKQSQPVETTLKVKAEGDAFLIETGSANKSAVRIARAHAFKPGTPFNELPAPIAAVRGPSGQWIGQGKLVGDQPVTNFTTTLVGDGPVLAQVNVRYEFGPRQFYELRIRVPAGQDVVLVDEAFALPEVQLAQTTFVSPPNLLAIPDTYNDWLVRHGIGWNAIPTDLDAYPRFDFDFTANTKFNRARGLGIGQRKPAYVESDLAHASDDPRLGFVLTPWQERGYRQNAIGFDAMPAPGQPATGDYVGIFARHGSQWVHSNENRVLMTWQNGAIVSHFTVFEGRRQWGLLIANAADVGDESLTKSDPVFTPLNKAMVKYGQTSLDKVKGWTFRVNDDGADSYPRLYYSGLDLRRMRKTMDALPDATREAILKDHVARAWYSRDDQVMRALFERELGRLKLCVSEYLEGGHNTRNTYTHRFQELVRSSAQGLDIALSSEAITAEQRQEAHAVLAFLAYKLSDQDYWPYRGYAGGPSNPNMMTVTINALATVAAMLPSHEQQQHWLHLVERAAQADMERSLGRDGVWLENPGYQTAGATPFMQTIIILNLLSTGELADDPKLAEAVDYFVHLLTPPDPRFDGKRIPMMLGDNTTHNANFFAAIARELEAEHPETAGHAAWSFQQMVQPLSHDPLLMLRAGAIKGDPSGIEPRPIKGESRVLPDFGAILRHGFGSSAETMLTYRQSPFAYGHYDDDQGSFSWYAKGAPIALDWMDYSPGDAASHNRVTYPANDYYWLVPEIAHHTLTPEADYLRSFEAGKQDDTVIMDGSGISEADADWHRQLLLVKDPVDPADATYMVLRDRIMPEGENTWNLWVMSDGPAQTIDKHTVRLPGQFGVDLLVWFFDRPDTDLAFTTRKHTTRSYLKMDQTQTRIQAQSVGPATYGVVLYPLRQGVDMPPKFTRNDDGRITLTFKDGRTHTIHLADATASLTKTREGQAITIPLETQQ